MTIYQTDNPSPEQIAHTSGKLVLEFGTHWCSHCQAAQAAVNAAIADHPAIQHLRVEDGKGRKLGRTFSVKLWPTLVFLYNGQELARVVRPTEPEEVRLALKKLEG